MPLVATNPSLAPHRLTRCLLGCHALCSPRAARSYSSSSFASNSNRRPIHPRACSDDCRASARLIPRRIWITSSPGARYAPLVRGATAGASHAKSYTTAARRISHALKDGPSDEAASNGRGSASGSHGVDIQSASHTAQAVFGDPGKNLQLRPPATRNFVARVSRFRPVPARIEEAKNRVNKRRRAATAKTKRRTFRSPTVPNAYLMYALEKTENAHGVPPGNERRADPLAVGTDTNSLQAVLARYMLAIVGTIETTAFQLTVFDPPLITLTTADETYLASKGYGVADLAHWASLLVARDIHAPAMMLFGPHGETSPLPPTFLFLFILQRKMIQARTLQILLRHARHLLDYRRAGSETLRLQTVMRIFVQLLRHARHVWPEGVVSMAQIISSHIRRTPDLDFAGKGLDVLRTSRVSALYNRVLEQLAGPMVARPFKSSVYQEIAQFDLLHAMASHRPPLRISRKGYRAVTRVLLSRVKTEQERDWTSLQASSWPPWKSARTGVDEEKGLEYGMSRAAISIERMVQAGYDPGRWGDIAKIYAGRDIDGSPVAQTRALLDTVKGEKADAMIWEARIKTTRTVREAWACFLSYSDTGAPPSELVYAAMITKLLLSQKTVSSGRAATVSRARFVTSTSSGQDDADGKVMAGDAIEPFPEPTFPRDRTYIPSEPPGPMDLFEQMLDRGLPPSEDILRSILQHLTNVEDGLKYLDVAGPPYSDWFRVLMSGDELEPHAILSISEPIFNSFVALLCRAPRTILRLVCSASGRGEGGPSPTSGWYLRRQSPARHALRLLFLRRSTNRSLWAGLLHALSDWHAPLAFGGEAESVERQAVLKLKMIRRVLVLMNRFGVEPGTDCLKAVSVGVEHAALASRRTTRPRKGSQRPADWLNAMQEMSEVHLRQVALSPWSGEAKGEAAGLEGGASRFLRALFERVISGEDMSTTDASAPLPDGHPVTISSLLAVPSPAELHSYVRALGVLGDHDGILSLVQWILEHHEAFWLQVSEERGGKRRFATLLAAIRVFLECPQSDRRVVKFGVSREMKPATRDLIERAKEAVNKIPDWTWPNEILTRQYIDGPNVYAEADRARPPSLSDYL